MDDKQKGAAGIIGLGAMGRNLARNLAGQGYALAIYDPLEENPEPPADTARLCKTAEDLAAHAGTPRRILLMIKAGEPVDRLIEALLPRLEKGDVVIDGGNSHYQDTIRRARALEDKGFHFIGAGISGGAEGALNGASIMAGGSEPAFVLAKPLLEDLSAEVDGAPCCALLGGDGAGHFVKTVHNGIEYALMQLIAEAYLVLAHRLGLSYPEMSDIFAAWNQGPLASYLVHVTARILAHKDAETGRPLVREIAEEAGEKGTGRWAAEAALALGVGAPTIAAAVAARRLTAPGADEASAETGTVPVTERAPLIDDLEHALAASFAGAFAQGFELIAAGGRQYGWPLDEIAIRRVWRGASIVSAKLLEETPVAGAAVISPEAEAGWRRIVAAFAESALPAPALASALAYHDAGKGRPRGANLIAAQRDCFGAHGYRRRGEKGRFTTDWSDD